MKRKPINGPRIARRFGNVFSFDGVGNWRLSVANQRAEAGAGLEVTKRRVTTDTAA